MQKLKQQLLFDRVLDKLPDHVTLLLVILSGFLLARLTWMLFPADPSLMASVKETPAAEVGVIPANVRSEDIGKEIAAAHLLGTYQPPPPPVEAVAPPAPVVAVVEAPPPPPPKPVTPRDPLKLVGVYALSGKAGVAVIDVKGQQQVFGIGEQIPGNGAVLERVFDNRVELSWSGKRETLSMPKMEASSDGAVTVDQEFVPEPEPVFDQPVMEQQLIPQPIAPPQEQVLQQQPGLPQVGLPQLGLPQTGLPQIGIPQPAESGVEGANRTTGAAGDPKPAMTPGQRSGSAASGAVNLASFREEVMENNIKLLEVLRPSPVKKDGQLTGFRVTPGRNRSLFEQTNLKAGDIVTEINGNPLNSDMASLQAMQGLASSGSAQLKVLRAGQLTDVHVSF